MCYLCAIAQEYEEDALLAFAHVVYIIIQKAHLCTLAKGTVWYLI